MDYDSLFKMALTFLITDIEHLKEIYYKLPLGVPFYNTVNDFYKNMKEITLNDYIKNIKDQFYIIHKDSPEGKQFKELILDKKEEGYPTSAEEYGDME